MASKLRHGDGSNSQRNRLIMALRAGPVSTIKARAELDIPHPAGRIQELRARGYEIDRTMIECQTSFGTKRRFAEYVLHE